MILESSFFWLFWFFFISKLLFVDDVGVHVFFVPFSFVLIFFYWWCWNHVFFLFVCCFFMFYFFFWWCCTPCFRCVLFILFGFYFFDDVGWSLHFFCFSLLMNFLLMVLEFSFSFCFLLDFVCFYLLLMMLSLFFLKFTFG